MSKKKCYNRKIINKQNKVVNFYMNFHTLRKKKTQSISIDFDDKCYVCFCFQIDFIKIIKRKIYWNFF